MTALWSNIAWLTDSSERAAAAATWVVRIATLSGASVCVAHATGASLSGSSPRPPGARDPERARIERAHAQAQATAETLQQQAIEAAACVEPGQPLDLAVSLVRTQQVGLVICGRSGTAGIDRWLVGSTTQRLVRKLPCDVLVVERPEGTRLRTILVPVEPGPTATPALMRARSLAQATGAELHLVTVLATPDPAALTAARERLDALARAHLGETRWRSVAEPAGRPRDGILRLAAGHDLVVMGTHGRSGLQRLVLGSVTEAVVRTCPAPVLVVRAPD